ncbi:MAG: rod shape-determining protein MreD [Coriobacteriia bacterium]|nr:rod shape-determining protein MreD [Coriobacteriia bacterium]
MLPTVGAIAAATLLQVAIAPEFAIGGVVPNFLLLVVVVIALVEGPRHGASAGFAAGLLLDLLGTSPVGPWALVLTLVGYGAGALQANMFAAGWLMPVTVALVAALGAELGYWLVLSVLGVGGPFVSTLAGVVLPGAVYDTVLALLVFPWLARLLRQGPSITTFKRLA